MVKIEHIGVYVQDLEGAKDFFIRYFRATASALYTNAKTGFQSYFLSFGEGCRLEIMTIPELQTHEDIRVRPGYAHIAFSVGGTAKVDELTAILSAGGYKTVDGPRITGDGYYESKITGFEGNIIEITE